MASRERTSGDPQRLLKHGVFVPALVILKLVVLSKLEWLLYGSSGAAEKRLEEKLDKCSSIKSHRPLSPASTSPAQRHVSCGSRLMIAVHLSVVVFFLAMLDVAAQLSFKVLDFTWVAGGGPVFVAMRVFLLPPLFQGIYDRFWCSRNTPEHGRAVEGIGGFVNVPRSFA
jgi:hypothetical protein